MTPTAVTASSSELADAHRLGVVRASLTRVRPRELSISRLHLRLYDEPNAGARRLGPWRQLTIGRPLIDRCAPERLDVWLGHEIGHLVDRLWYRPVLAYLGGLLCVLALILAAFGVLPVPPSTLAPIVLFALAAMLLAMPALLRSAEYRADRVAVALTSRQAFLDWMQDERSRAVKLTGLAARFRTHPHPDQRAARIIQAFPDEIGDAS